MCLRSAASGNLVSGRKIWSIVIDLIPHFAMMCPWLKYNMPQNPILIIKAPKPFSRDSELLGPDIALPERSSCGKRRCSLFDGKT